MTNRLAVAVCVIAALLSTSLQAQACPYSHGITQIVEGLGTRFDSLEKDILEIRNDPNRKGWLDTLYRHGDFAVCIGDDDEVIPRDQCFRSIVDPAIRSLPIYRQRVQTQLIQRVSDAFRNRCMTDTELLALRRDVGDAMHSLIATSWQLDGFRNFEEFSDIYGEIRRSRRRVSRDYDSFVRRHCRGGDFGRPLRCDYSDPILSRRDQELCVEHEISPCRLADLRPKLESAKAELEAFETRFRSWGRQDQDLEGLYLVAYELWAEITNECRPASDNARDGLIDACTD